MLTVSSCSPFAVCRSLFVVWCVLCVCCCLVSVACCLLLVCCVARWCLSVGSCFSLLDCCLQCIVCGLLSGADVIIVVCCLVFAARCDCCVLRLLFGVCRLLCVVV